ncbi:MAG: hypothetical protein Q9M24_09725 [Mariprofundaceae bacterium]|nr:hypothetical protein [Mariprofundaceae bacterium]
MTRWWRNALVASLILLLAISGVLFLRLDPGKLSASVQSQLQQWSGQKIQVGSASLSLFQGLSLRIQDVDIQSEKQAWHLHADNIRLGLSVWHLLQGKTSIKSAEIIRPVLDFSKPPQMKKLAMIALSKPLEWVRIRQGRIRITGKIAAQGFDATVRRISREREMTWELQSKLFGGDLTTQGRIRYDAQGRRSAFGKLKARHILLNGLPVSLAGLALPQLAYESFETSLTFDANTNREWSLFGDAEIHASLKNMPPVTWRGKVKGTGLQRLNWHDAFLRIGRNAMFSTSGECTHGKGCNFGIDTRNAEIPLILKAINLNIPIKGTLDTKVSVSWKNGQWSTMGKLASHHVSWSDISVPDTTISIPNALYRVPGHFELENIHLQPAEESGDIVLEKLHRSAQEWNLNARIRNMANGWVPFANILLKLNGMAPDVRGEGILNAEIYVSMNSGHRKIGFSVDSSQARLIYAKAFEKPKGVRANITAHLDTRGNRSLFSIHNMDLGDSHAEQIQWVIGQGKTKSVSAKQIRVDLAKLKQNGIILPDTMKDWHGTIRGRFSHVQPVAGTPVTDWFSKSGANLQLNAFGPKGNTWDGLINIRDGTLSTQNLYWETTGQHARLDGAINLFSKQGNINLQDATLSWKQGDALPAWLGQAELHGYLRNINLDWMGNTWGGLHGAYRTRGNHITLKKIRGKLAGGSIQSPKMSLVLSPESVRFSGPVRMAIVRLNKLRGLSEALGAKLDGYMYLNANLEGKLPWHTKSPWRGNGDIEIQHGYWQPVDKKLTISVGGLRMKTSEMIPFSRFTTRFNLERRVLQFTRMQLETGAKQITGNAFLHPNGEIGGNLQIRNEHGMRKSRLLGNWPEATGIFGTNQHAIP